LNTDKALPIISSIIVDNYIPLIGKKIKRGYFLPLPYSLFKLEDFLKKSIGIIHVIKKKENKIII